MDKGIVFSPEALSKGLKEIYDGLDVKNIIERFIFEETLRLFNEATAKGIADAADSSAVTDEFMEQLRTNNAVFSAFRTHRMQNDVARQLIDEKGKLKPFDRWMRDIEGMTNHYVRNWLQTEYSTAIIRAHQAADWKYFEQEADVLPNLRWMPTTSIEQDPLHRQYWEKKLTLPVGHPFWDEHRPGDRWNCKCSLRQTDEPVNDDIIKDFYPIPKQPGLDNNPGKDGKLFADSHPYIAHAYPGAKEAVRKKVRSFEEAQSIRERWQTRKQFNANIQEVAKAMKMTVPQRQMTFEEADGMRGNPKYLTSRMYQINCQCSVVANEMRRRGFDVSARPNRRIKDSIPTRLSYQTELIWKDPKTGDIPTLQTTYAATPTGMKNDFARQTQSPGRYHLLFHWKNYRGGHIITFERGSNGTGIFYDPQSGKIMKENDFYFDRINTDYGIKFYRVDNLLVNTDMISGAVTKQKG